MANLTVFYEHDLLLGYPNPDLNHKYKPNYLHKDTRMFNV